MKKFKRLIKNIKVEELDELFIDESLIQFAKTSKYSIMKFFFTLLVRYLLKHNIIQKNLMLNIKNYQKKSSQKKVFNSEEYSVFLKAIEKNKYYLEFLVMTQLGLRVSEALGLKFSDIDYTNRTISISRNVVYSTKSKSQIISNLKTSTSRRVLVLTDKLIMAIKERKEEIEKNKNYFKKSYLKKFDGFMCVNEIGDIIRSETLNYNINKICKENNLPLLTNHGLRHSVATLLYENGVDIKNIQHFLGHADIKMTCQTYIRYNTSKVFEIKNVLDNILS